MSDRMLDLLYRSFDDELSVLEQAMLDKALADSEDLRSEQARIQAMRESLQASTREGFSLGFIDRVMARVERRGLDRWIQGNLVASIRSMFRWVVVATVPVLVALAIWNFQLEAPTDTQPRSADEPVLWETPLERVLRNGS